MKTVAVLNTKGGSGKTTIATNIAVCLRDLEKRVMLVDADPQASARDWNVMNKGSMLPVVGLDRETLEKDLKAVSHGYDWVVIDGAPQIAKLSIVAIKASDMVLIPVQPSPWDIWACAALVEAIKIRQDITEGKPRAAFVISRAIKNTKLHNEVKEALKDYKLPIFKNGTTQRVSYPTYASEGQTVIQSPDKEAIEEVHAMTSELISFMERQC